MRKILLLLSILSVTLGAKAQLFGGSWEKGEVVDRAGNKQVYFISTSKPFSQIDELKVRTDMKADNIVLSADKIKSFTINYKAKTDSFEVSHQEEFHDKPFFKLMLDKSTKLYNQNKQISSGGTPGMGNFGGMGGGASVGIGFSYAQNSYFLGPDVEHLTKMKRSDFKKTMCELLSDNVILVNEIKTGTFHYAEMQDLIESYKTGVLIKPYDIAENN